MAQKLVIRGGKPLKGEIVAQGAKNSVLPVTAAAVLSRGETLLTNCPQVSDLYASCRILNSLGIKCHYSAGTLSIRNDGLSSVTITEDLMRTMRSSIVFLGALLGLEGECRLSYPGGCELGPRPIDIHISAMRLMGAVISEDGGELICRCPNGLHGAKIALQFPSVGATENILLAAVRARGSTEIINAAREPEITELAAFLNRCGAKISGEGGGAIHVEGVESLRGCAYSIMPDRIVTATLLLAAAATMGEIVISSMRAEELGAFIPVLEQMGCAVFYPKNGSIYLKAPKRLRAVRTIKTMPYPGFPTDLQAITMAALSTASGTSVFVENIFEDRYRHVDALNRMGADIRVVGKAAIIEGVHRLNGARLSCPDLRGGAALAVAALRANGITELDEIQHIDRGYQAFEKQLAQLGADIERRT